jgi:thiol-disulfide isomerase/thioredoxin
MKALSFALVFACSLSMTFAQDKKEPEVKAPAGYSVGSVVADFTLNDAEGKKTSLKTIAEGKKFIVLNFWSRECPAAKATEPAFVKLYADYSGKGVAFVHMASNKKENKAEADVTATKEYAKSKNITWPVLLDVDNKVADVFGGQKTPHVYVVDVKDMKVVYMGSINDSVWKAENVKKEYVREALDLLLAGKAVATPSTPPEGCTIKRVVS